MRHKFNLKLKYSILIPSIMLIVLFVLYTNLTFASEVNSGENFDTAILINGDNKVISGNYKDNTSVMYYRIELKNPGELKLNLKSYLANEIKVEIYNRNLELLHTSTCIYDNQKKYGTLTDDNFYETGVYYIRLQKMFANGAGKFEFSAKYVKPNTIDKESNNDITKAQEVKVQKTVTGMISFTDSIEYYYVDITNEKNLSIIVTPKFETSFIVTILDKDGNKIESGIASYTSSTKKTISYQFNVKKPFEKYYILIQVQSIDKTGKYTIQTKADVNIDSITLSTSKVTLYTGKSKTVKAITSPINATESYSFFSSNKSVATISKAGKITAKKAGTATITVKSKSGKVIKKCEVIVKDVKVKSVNLNITNKTLKIGSTYNLKVKISPSNATNKKVTWKSSNSSVAKVSSSGKITAIKPGTVKISVTTKDGSYKKTCTIKVVRPVTGVTLNISSKIIYKGQSFSLKTTVKPSNATNKGYTYYSSNTSVAYINSTGVVTARGVGTAVITVKTKDGGKKDTCKVTVIQKETTTETEKPSTSTPSPSKVVKITDIYIDGCSISVGDSQKLNVTVSPKNSTNKKLTYKSSNTKVATVSSSGVVKGVAKGTTIITVTSSNGVKNFCTVVVK